MSDQIIVFVCNCCQKPAHAVFQAYDHPKMKNRPPLIQVECLTPGCKNNYWTYSYQEGGDNEQVASRYTPVPMTHEQAERFVKAATE